MKVWVFLNVLFPATLLCVSEVGDGMGKMKTKTQQSETFRQEYTHPVHSRTFVKCHGADDSQLLWLFNTNEAISSLIVSFQGRILWL